MKTLSILLFILSFTQCATTQFEKNTPFIIKSANYKHWSGGQPAISGINVQIQLKEKSNINFDSLYFRNKVTKVTCIEGSLIIANFKTSKNKVNDVILHADPKKEIHNKIPASNKLPFKLKESEAILSYQLNGKTKYYKIASIKKRNTDTNYKKQ